MLQAAVEAHYILGRQPALNAFKPAPVAVEFFKGADITFENFTNDFFEDLRVVVRGHHDEIALSLSPNVSGWKAKKVDRSYDNQQGKSLLYKHELSKNKLTARDPGNAIELGCRDGGRLV